ncbi:MAG: hypothetical protein ABR502_04120 [Chitinophagaceae bacterium]
MGVSKKICLLFLCAFTCKTVFSQKIDSIFFNLYTDSLKKGFYNYINIDAKFPDGTWLPLTPDEIFLTSNAGRFEGNDLFIDSTYKGDSVVVKAVLKSNPAVYRQIIIYIRKRGFTEPLKTNDDILNELKQSSRKKNRT